mmetsp:Transcript_5843/g.4420  ORF Transcript_5843/g.4420 Transcript_5843/m.4420 type:complete len:94 (-) Transcript_5843:118-399(-)
MSVIGLGGSRRKRLSTISKISKQSKIVQQRRLHREMSRGSGVMTKLVSPRKQHRKSVFHQQKLLLGEDKRSLAEESDSILNRDQSEISNWLEN